MNQSIAYWLAVLLYGAFWTLFLWVFSTAWSTPIPLSYIGSAGLYVSWVECRRTWIQEIK